MSADVKKSEQEGIQRREHYRIKYPITEQPTFVVNKVHFEIIDVSENGIRIRLARGKKILISHNINVTVMLKNKIVTELYGSLSLMASHNYAFTPDPDPNLEKIKTYIRNRNEYPFDLIIMGIKISKADLSKDAIMINDYRKEILKKLPEVSGMANFLDSEQEKISGKILRFQQTEMAIKLSTGVPYGKIIKEQLYLKRKYNMFEVIDNP